MEPKGYCNWGKASAITLKYHDEEWGVPVHDDTRQFEYLMMEVMQCGLSWDIVMKKREILRRAFDGFNFDKIAAYGEAAVSRILATEGMIRSRRKIEAIIHNARCFQKLRRERGTFSAWLWAFTEGKTILYEKHGEGYIPAANGLSERVSLELRKRGFKYLGAVTVYAHLQACGIINDHDKRCPRYAAINAATQTVVKRRDHEKAVRKF